jgi:RNA polymerase sigma-54 factor
MALGFRLEMRQGQSLVMTPQLLQAIKLLQFSQAELNAFVEAELERNPLLERGDGLGEDPVREMRTIDDWSPDGGNASPAATDRDGFSGDSAALAAGRPLDGPDALFEPTDRAFDGGERDWDSGRLETTRDSLEGALDTGLVNVFPDDGPAAARSEAGAMDRFPVGTSPMGGGGSDEDLPGLEATLASEASLQDHLLAQLDIALPDPVDRLIARHIVDGIDAAGYLVVAVDEIAQRLGADPARVETVLAAVQSCDPSGVGARDLAECLAIQLREQDRFDPAMAALVSRLDLVAKRDYAQLRRICGVDDEDIADMIAEIRRLEPKPGRAFGGEPVQVMVPDVFVRPAPDGSWIIELNSETLPRVLVNQAYIARVARDVRSAPEKAFIAECLQTANWLTRSLEQRARTILKVASEIVRQQDEFFARGVEHLRPLNLRTVADAIGMHESTVSRVTANKAIGTHRGVFEMKYFFSASIAGTNGASAHSAESVRFRIRQMIDAESPQDVLSDDLIVAKLKEAGIDIARRTVAKYRESLRIPSSVERRRDKAPARALT